MMHSLIVIFALYIKVVFTFHLENGNDKNNQSLESYKVHKYKGTEEQYLDTDILKMNRKKIENYIPGGNNTVNTTTKPSFTSRITEENLTSVNMNNQNVTDTPITVNIASLCNACVCRPLLDKCKQCCLHDIENDDEVKYFAENESPTLVVEEKVDCARCVCSQDRSDDKCCSTCSFHSKQQEPSLTFTNEHSNNSDHGEIKTNDKAKSVNMSSVNANSINNIDIATAVKPDDDKFKYILGETFIMLIIPVSLLLLFVIYRKIKHLYQRRHYSRANYLIDGMYCERNPLCFSDVIHLSDR